MITWIFKFFIRPTYNVMLFLIPNFNLMMLFFLVGRRYQLRSDDLIPGDLQRKRLWSHQPGNSTPGILMLIRSNDISFLPHGPLILSVTYIITGNYTIHLGIYHLGRFAQRLISNCFPVSQCDLMIPGALGCSLSILIDGF